MSFVIEISRDRLKSTNRVIYEFKLSKYEFKLSKYEFKLSNYEFKHSKYEFEFKLAVMLVISGIKYS